MEISSGTAFQGVTVQRGNFPPCTATVVIASSAAVKETEAPITGMLGAFAGSWPEALKGQHELDARMKDLAEGTFTRLKLFSMLECLPASQSYAVAAARADARQRCVAAGIAAARYRLEHGRLPNSLADVEQKFRGLSSEPSRQFIDPFDGQPLRYKMESTRVLIYSIGSNDKDDGGDCDQDPGKNPPLDIGFYLKK